MIKSVIKWAEFRTSVAEACELVLFLVFLDDDDANFFLLLIVIRGPGADGRFSSFSFSCFS